tara:strand:+ start:261 stop:440 length:180 start_codon:yes stop_codon:yes gene_type:complete
MSVFSKFAERNIKKFIASKIGKLGKKGAILWAVGFIVKHTPTKKDDAMFEVVKKALKGF